MPFPSPGDLLNPGIKPRSPALQAEALTSAPPGKPFCLQCRRPGFDPWVGKILWRRERLSIPVLWPGDFHRLYRPWGHKESDPTERLSLTLKGKEACSGPSPSEPEFRDIQNLRRRGWEEQGLLSAKAEIPFYTAEPSKRRFSKVSLWTEFPETPLWEREGRREAGEGGHWGHSSKGHVLPWRRLRDAVPAQGWAPGDTALPDRQGFSRTPNY